MWISSKRDQILHLSWMYVNLPASKHVLTSSQGARIMHVREPILLVVQYSFVSLSLFPKPTYILLPFRPNMCAVPACLSPSIPCHFHFYQFFFSLIISQILAAAASSSSCFLVFSPTNQSGVDFSSDQSLNKICPREKYPQV